MTQKRNEIMFPCFEKFLWKSFHTFYRYRYTICESKQHTHTYTQFNVHFQCVSTFFYFFNKFKRSEKTNVHFSFAILQLFATFWTIFTHTHTSICSLNEYEMNSAASEMIANMLVRACEKRQHEVKIMQCEIERMHIGRKWLFLPTANYCVWMCNFFFWRGGRGSVFNKNGCKVKMVERRGLLCFYPDYILNG